MDAVKILRDRLAAVEALNVCYRIGKRPTEKLMSQLDKTKKMLDKCIFDDTTTKK